MKKTPIRARKDWFSSILLTWDQEKNQRSMPWKGEKDPYRIWLSEIILQQTRVEQGISYYQRFVQRFPDVNALANASEAEVFKLWEGLGYYSRCRNLLATAKTVANDHRGVFPNAYEHILALKGVGPYTAAAIASFAFDHPHAVVDGNVFRVLSRISGNATAIDTTGGKKYFSSLANEWLDKKQPGRYNQAIMDFGATICKPQSPDCGSCPFQFCCFAFQEGRVSTLPVKEKKISIRKRWFNYFLFRHNNKIAVVPRNKKDIWRGLYEFPLLETKKQETVARLIKMARDQEWIDREVKPQASFKGRQQLSHQLITGRIIVLNLSVRPVTDEWLWVTEKQMKKMAFPAFINNFLRLQNEKVKI